MNKKKKKYHFSAIVSIDVNAHSQQEAETIVFKRRLPKWIGLCDLELGHIQNGKKYYGSEEEEMQALRENV